MYVLVIFAQLTPVTNSPPYSGFALYRALLRRSSLLPLAEKQQSALRLSIQKTFRKHADVQSKRRITAVLQAGYDVGL